MILVPLFDLKFLNEPRRNCCRNFKSAALGNQNSRGMEGTTIKMPSRRSVLAGFAGLAATKPFGQARGQAYPERTVTLVVPFPPGGSTDILARVVAEHLRRSLNQPVI